MLSTFGIAVVRWERGEPDRCPECGSYRLHFATRRNEQQNRLENVTTYEACDWQDITPEEYVELVEPEPDRIVDGECVTSDQISTFMSPQEFIHRHS